MRNGRKRSPFFLESSFGGANWVTHRRNAPAVDATRGTNYARNNLPVKKTKKKKNATVRSATGDRGISAAEAGDGASDAENYEDRRRAIKMFESRLMRRENLSAFNAPREAF